jgi:hypothetical protein
VFRRPLAGASVVRDARGCPLGVMRFLAVTTTIAVATLVGVAGIVALVLFAVGCIAKGFFEEVGGGIAASFTGRLRSREPLAAGSSWAKTAGGAWVPLEPLSMSLLSQVDTAATDDKNGVAGPAERSTCG